MAKQSKIKTNQVQFFEMLRQHLQAHETLVDTVSELLDVSIDVSYRKIRGATSLRSRPYIIFTFCWVLWYNSTPHEIHLLIDLFF